MTINFSPLQIQRLKYQPELPKALSDFHLLSFKQIQEDRSHLIDSNLENYFPFTSKNKEVRLEKTEQKEKKTLKVGVVFSGGQAPGGHNVVVGLFDALKKLNVNNRLFGFLDGPQGIISNKSIELTQEILANYRNQGGFDLLGSGRTKIESPEDFRASAATVSSLDLDGLVVIGGDDSNTNAAFLAEYFKEKRIKTKVCGVPKTIDGDLKNQWIEMSFGFDTACKVYSEIIGNLLRDALSAKKYYFFVKMMGRSASHVTLECALRTQVNLALISEEIEKKEWTLEQLTAFVADMICKRAENGKDYGLLLIPEGIIEFIPEFRQMIKELNAIKDQNAMSDIQNHLSSNALHCFQMLPKEIQQQLFLERDPHGNIQVSKIETERLLIDLVSKELNQLKANKKYKGKFTAQPFFCGYEGRSALPSNFDAQYCYSLGHVAALLVESGLSGYMACVGNLDAPVNQWSIYGIPLFKMLAFEERAGKTRPVLKKSFVDLQGKSFLAFASQRDEWMLNDHYLCPGPIQF